MEHVENQTEERISYKDIFRQKEYCKVIISNIISRFGDSIDAIAFTWLVYAITGSASWSAVVFAANQLPSVLVQPFAGALVEGLSKKKIMVLTDAIRGIVIAGLAVLYMADLLNPWILMLFTLFISTAEAFRIPASMAAIPKLLEKKYYAHGTSLNSTISNVVQLAGLGAAGFIIGSFGIHTAILIDAVTFLGSAFILSFLRLEETNLRKGKLPAREYFETLKGGVIYLKNSSVICNFCMMAVIINALIIPISSLQTPLIVEIMGQGSTLLSIFSIALTLGMGLGSFTYPIIRKYFQVRGIIVGSGVMVGISLYLYTWGTGVSGQSRLHLQCRSHCRRAAGLSGRRQSCRYFFNRSNFYSQRRRMCAII
ncbi:MFS family permease [Anaerotaenia torta]|uniref:MFS transporter n=1 Tax=Anaerotaenia torta TaxID=433293 RepID=UPI003D21107D